MLWRAKIYDISDSTWTLIRRPLIFVLSVKQSDVLLCSSVRFLSEWHHLSVSGDCLSGKCNTVECQHTTVSGWSDGVHNTSIVVYDNYCQQQQVSYGSILPPFACAWYFTPYHSSIVLYCTATRCLVCTSWGSMWCKYTTTSQLQRVHSTITLITRRITRSTSILRIVPCFDMRILYKTP